MKQKIDKYECFSEDGLGGSSRHGPRTENKKKCKNKNSILECKIE